MSIDKHIEQEGEKKKELMMNIENQSMIGGKK